MSGGASNFISWLPGTVNVPGIIGGAGADIFQGNSDSEKSIAKVFLVLYDLLNLKSSC